MLARAANPNRVDTEIQNDSQGNSLAAGKEHLLLLMSNQQAKVLQQNEGSTDGAVLDNQINHAIRRRNGHGRPKPLSCFSNISKSKRRSDRRMASGFRGFVCRSSSRDNPTHVKEGYLLTLLEG